MLKLKRLKKVLPIFLLITAGVLAFLLLHKTPFASASDTVDSTSVSENVSQTNTGSQVVFVSDQVGYSFHLSATNTVVYNKTTNGGTTWGSGVTVDSQTDTEKVSVWYDRWTPGDTTGNFIYIITTDSGASDIWYRTLDTSGDTLSGAGMVSVTSSPGPNKSNSFVAGGEVASITKGTDGVLYVGIIDATSSYIIKCSATCTTASNWADAGTSPLDASDQNWSALIPLASGNIMVIEHNDSVDDTLSKVWNGSAWDAGWATIDSNCIVNLNSSMGSMGVTVDRTGSSVYIVEACDNVTLGTDDDIRSYSYSGGAWTAKTDVLTNQTRGITNSKIARDENTGDLYVLYLTTASGTPTDLTTQSIFWKKSTNGMTSWGSESSALAGPDTLSSGTLNFTSSERIYGTWGQDNGGSADSYNGATLADLVSNLAPAAPTLIDPPTSATGVSNLPIFQLRTTDTESDYLKYFIQIYDATACGGSQVGSDIDQNVSQTGWQGQDAGPSGNTAYFGSSTIGSSSIARYQHSGTALTPNHLYSWRAKAKDPGGNNNFGSLSSCQDFTTAASEVQIRGGTNINGGATIQ